MSTSTSDKQRPHPKRATFLQAREVLERSRNMLEHASDVLRDIRSPDPRTELFCKSLDALQRDLSVALREFCDSAPATALEEQTQYTVEVPENPETLVMPTGLEEGLTWSLALTRGLRHRFQGLADAAIAESLREAYENLAQLVLGYEKRISRLAQEGHDL